MRQPIFDIESRRLSKTVVIAHVSPHLQDTAHSVNTLSYASPFKMAPPKLLGPAPYDETDPRTWEHDQTVAWLEAGFRKRAIKRRDHAHAERERKAKAIHKKVAPLDPDAPVVPTVNVDAFCPEPMTARHLGRLYAGEWIEQCMRAKSDDKSVRVEEVKNDAAAVYGDFNYMLLTARTRTRTELFKSRKKLVAAETYGAWCRLFFLFFPVRLPQNACVR